MDNGPPEKHIPFDIQERTFQFAVRIVSVTGKLPRTVAATEIARQLIGAGTSVGANMEEAGEGLSKRDFFNHVKIARKEAKESRYWLAIIDATDLLADPEIPALRQEATDLVRILTSIVKRSTR